MAEPPVSSTGSPHTDDSSELSQPSPEYQQPFVSHLPPGGPVISEVLYGGSVNFNFQHRVGEHFPPLTSGSLFIAALLPPSPHHLLANLAADSNMDSSPSSSEGVPTSSEYYQLFPEINPEPSILSSSGTVLPAGYRSSS